MNHMLLLTIVLSLIAVVLSIMALTKKKERFEEIDYSVYQPYLPLLGGSIQPINDFNAVPGMERIQDQVECGTYSPSSVANLYSETSNLARIHNMM